jgi:SAM-dependent methyltransferase
MNDQMPQTLNEEERRGLEVTPGGQHYRAFIGPPQLYDLLGASQFNLLTLLGLRETHTMLEIGCGSLRAGKLFLAYLLPGRYHGIEPEEWLLNDGIQHEVGADLINLKQPRFLHDRNFSLSAFNTQFDFLLAQSILSHTSQAQIKQCLSEAKKVMKPSSIFAATYHRGDVNYEGDKWVYPDVIPYRREFIIDLIANEGFQVREIEWSAPNGQYWLLITRPDYQGPALAFDDRVPVLLAERNRYRRRVEELENHPYVRVGMAIKKLLRRG